MKKLDPEADRKTVAHLADAINKIHGDWRHPLLRSFFMGLMTALGATIGFAIFTTLVGYLLSWLGVIPGLSAMSNAINEFLSQSALR